MDQIVPLRAEKFQERKQAGDIPQWTNRSADDVEIYDAEAVGPDGFLKRRVRGENVSLPALLTCRAGEAENNCRRAPEPGVAYDVQDTAGVFYVQHGLLPRRVRGGPKQSENNS